MKNAYDTSGELLLLPWINGAKLIHPGLNCSHEQTTTSISSIQKMLDLPLNVYFLDRSAYIQNMNERAIDTCGYPSLKKTIGKNVFAAAKKESATKINIDNAKVIDAGQMNVFEEHFVRLNDISFPALSFKFPLYGDHDQILGLFGYSLILDANNISAIADTIKIIMKLGLLTTAGITQDAMTILPGRQLCNTYLSKRETECLHLLLKGRTTKMIAEILNISPRTVEHHLENIKAKFGVRTKADLIIKANEN